VDALRDLSQAISKDLDVNMQLLTMDNQRVRLSGRADGFNTVDAIKSRLEASDNFAKVTISGAKASADGKGVQFTLELLRQRVNPDAS
jgi:general secretion pathway protein L